MSSLPAKPMKSSQISSKRSCVVVDEIHLVDAEHEVLHLEQRRDHRVAARLLEHPLARVDQHEREVGGGRAGHHVARVLHVPGRVGDDELAARSREVAVGDVDRDALLALGAQAVGEQREVGVVEAAIAAGALHRFELILEDLLRLQQQTPDERALAVVDRARSSKPEKFHQNGRFRCGVPAVPPRLRCISTRSSPRACGLPWPPR